MGGLARMFENKKQHGIATGDPDADAFLRENPNAILIGLLLDQQMRAEVAFSGPYKLHERLGHLDVERIAEMDTDDLGDVFGEKPAIHRFYNMMAGRVHTLAQYLTEHYDGDGSKLWEDGADEATIKGRAKDLPGFGKSKVDALPEALMLFGYRSFEG